MQMVPITLSNNAVNNCSNLLMPMTSQFNISGQNPQYSQYTTQLSGLHSLNPVFTQLNNSSQQQHQLQQQQQQFLCQHYRPHVSISDTSPNGSTNASPQAGSSIQNNGVGGVGNGGNNPVLLNIAMQMTPMNNMQLHLNGGVNGEACDITCKEENEYNSSCGLDNSMISSQVCAICGDKVTGKHYGAFSCDGCKGFFRRSVRKNHQYMCRNNRHCTIDKDKRNQCRYCRMQKCNKAGMRREAVQNERDKIANRRNILDEYNDGQVDITVSQIVAAEHCIRKMYPKSHDDICCDNKNQQQQVRHADLGHICESMQQQLRLIVEWAKKLPCFVGLGLQDQMAMLKAHAGELLILGVLFRSIKQDMLILGNDFVISKDVQNSEIKKVSDQIFEKLFNPLKSIDIDDVEYACFKTIIFFDPYTKGLSEGQSQHIHRIRYHVQSELMSIMIDKQYSPMARFGEMLLLLPELRSVTQLLIEVVKSAQHVVESLNNINDLLCEMLLTDLSIKQDINNNCDMTMPQDQHSPAGHPAAIVAHPTVYNLHNIPGLHLINNRQTADLPPGVFYHHPEQMMVNGDIGNVIIQSADNNQSQFITNAAAVQHYNNQLRQQQIANQQQILQQQQNELATAAAFNSLTTSGVNNNGGQTVQEQMIQYTDLDRNNTAGQYDCIKLYLN